jgi:hypothetical protein
MCRAIHAYHDRPTAYVKFLAALFEKLSSHERSPLSGVKVETSEVARANHKRCFVKRS